MGRRADVVAGLRELAAWIERHTEVMVPWVGAMSLPALTREEFLGFVRSLGSGEKFSDRWHIGIQHDFGGGVVMRTFVEHALVCERRVRTVTVPATAAQVVPARPEHDEEVVEWVCPESIILALQS